MYVEFKKILFAILFCDTIKKNFTIKNSIKNINLSIIDILNLFLIYEINYLANKKNIFYYIILIHHILQDKDGIVVKIINFSEKNIP